MPEGQRLQLQLQVAESEDSYVAFRLAVPQAGIANVAVNGVPDFGHGPLAFAHLQTGSGLRAALLGESAGLIRLVLAIVFSGLAVLVHPRTKAGLRRAGATTRRLARRPTARVCRLVTFIVEEDAGEPTTRVSRILGAPWYPWPVVAVPILHFLISNPFHFAVTEAVIPVGVALMFVTGSVVGLRLFLKEWHRPAAATTAGTVAFFAYGYIEHALDGRVDERAVFAVAVVLGAATVAQVLRSGSVMARLTQFFNLVSAVLLVFLAVGIVIGSCSGEQASRSVLVADRAARLHPSIVTTASTQRPDIYYIILDAYGRHDALGEFDNVEFLQALEDRGFYVASEATSNYRYSNPSMAATLNMSYLDDLGHQESASTGSLSDAIKYNYLASIMKQIGYVYIHLESGYAPSNDTPLADISVSFRPSGVFINKNQGDLNGQPRSRMFVRSLLDTTILRLIAGQNFLSLFPREDDPYDWWAPERTIQMFDFLASPIYTNAPRFVFAHIVKPHLPATFDQYGNVVQGRSKYNFFDDNHDPDVPDAYIGQLIYINSLVLKMIDGILDWNNADNTIIVIAGDHGRPGKYGPPGEYDRHAILAAFHMPKGGGMALYPSISSVNHFRVILDFYFNTDIGVLDDRNLDYYSG